MKGPEAERVKVLLKRCLLDADDEVRDRAAFYLRGTVDTSNVWVWGVAEEKLLEYMQRGDFSNSFEWASVPKVSQEKEMEVEMKRKEVELVGAEPVVVEKIEVATSKIHEVESIRKLGAILNSSERVLITEQEEEYLVYCTKHTLERHVVFEYEIKNTLEEIVLENVIVEMVPPVDGLRPMFCVPAERCTTTEIGYVFAVFEKQELMPSGIKR
jgi:coatomer protein complex subunit gamma